VVLDNDAVPLEDAIGFGSGNGETVSTGVQLDRCSQGKLAIASVRNFIWPDKLSEAEESIEAGE
jgi:hypothetical protein